jgi:hypothetical protein
MTSAAASWPLDDTTVTQSYSRVLNPAITPTRNIVINGGFDTDTVWQHGTTPSLTIANGVAHNDGSNVVIKDLVQSSIPYVIGKFYNVTFTLSNVTAGTIKPIFGGAAGTNRSTNGTFTEILSPTSAGNLLLEYSAGFIGDIDNVTITQLNIPSSGSTPTNLLTDGTMEAAGVGAWSLGSAGTTLSKDTTSPHGGTQNLRATLASGSNPYALQTILTPGTTYRLFGYYRADGTTGSTGRVGISPYPGALATSQSTNNWQPFDVVSVAGTGSTQAYFQAISNTIGAYAEFDDMTVSVDNSLRPGELTQDGNMEVADTSNWTVGNSATLTKQTTGPHGGSQVLRVARNGVNNAEATQPLFVVGKTYRVTGWYRSDGNATPYVLIGGTTPVNGTTSTSWQYFDIYRVADSSSLHLRASTSNGTEYVEFDDISVTEVPPLVGLPTNGVTLGSASGGHLTNAYTFDGTNDNVNVYSSDLNSTFNPDEGTLVAWAKVSDVSIWSDGSTSRNIVQLKFDNSNYITIYKLTSQPNLVYNYMAGGTNKGPNYVTSSPTGWFQVAFTWSKSSDQVKAYLNGTQAGATTTGLGTWSGNLSTAASAIGAAGSSGGNPWSGLINDVRLYTRALSSDEIADLYSSSSDRQAYYTENYTGKELIRQYNTSITVSAPATEEVGGGPIAYWKFDEGTGTTTNDSSSYGFTATFHNLASPSTPASGWQTEDQCISGKCISFDGSNDYLSLATATPLQIPTKTVSFWAKPKAAISTTQPVFSLSDGVHGNWYVGFTVTNAMIASHAKTDLSQQTTGSANNVVIPGEWHLYSYVFSVSGANVTVTMYVDGKQVANTTYATGYSSTYGTAPVIGSFTSGSLFFNGFIDDVKIYPYARTAAQIKADYTGKGTINGAAVAMGTNATANQLNNGLVGYWKMNEATWSGTLNEVVDSSGNGNNGTAAGAVGGLAYPTGGKFGNGALIDGTDDYVDLGTPSTLQFTNTQPHTLAAWIYVNNSASGYGYIMSYSKSGLAGDPAWYFFYNATAGIWPQNSIVAEYYDGARFTGIYTATNTLSKNVWHHVVFIRGTSNATTDQHIYIDGVEQSFSVRNLANNSNPTSINYTGLTAKIGARSSSSSFNGTIDELRVYNRALSPSEVQSLYNFAPGPVGYWKFEEGNGTTALDSSGNGYSGSLTGSSYLSGKFGKAVSFTGNAGSFVSVNDTTALRLSTAGTVETWINPTTYPNNSDNNHRWSVILNKGSWATGRNAYNIYYQYSDSTLHFDVDGATASDSVSTSWTKTPLRQWTHLALVWDGTKVYGYVNGTQVGSVTQDQTPATTTAIYVGSHDGGTQNFTGAVDDVKIYNYARTASQITEDMLGGHPASSNTAPLGYWKLDEGQGTVANNSGTGGTNLNGTLSGFSSPATATSGWIATGKIGKALVFDGTNDYVDIYSTTLNNSFNPSEGSLEAWAKVSGPGTWTDGATRMIAQLQTDTNNRLYIRKDTSNNSILAVYVAGSTVKSVTDTSLNGSTRWFHVVLTWSKSQDQMKLYINGNQAGTTQTGLGTWVGSLSSTACMIGLQTQPNTSPWSGLIDEVKYYPFALTSDQVKTSYNAGSSVSYGTKSASGSNLTEGLVGWWKMNESSWNGTANEVIDSSGAGNNGVRFGDATTTAAGKFANAGTFDGTGDYVTCGGGSSITSLTAFTFAAWIKSSAATTAPLFSFSNSSTEIEIKNPTNRSLLQLGPNNYRYFDNSTDLGSNTWHHVVFVMPGGNQSDIDNSQMYVDGVAQAISTGVNTGPQNSKSACQIAIYGGQVYTGLLDDVRLYNRALSPAEIQQLYNAWSPDPVAYWNFEEGGGTTVNDKSGNANTGTWNGSGNHWVSGRSSKAGNFNGASDYVDVYSANLASAFNGKEGTITSWVKINSPSNDGTNRGIFMFFKDNNNYFEIFKLTTGNLRFRRYANSVYSQQDYTVPANTWLQLAIAYSESQDSFKAYVNGTQIGSTVTGLGTWSGSIVEAKIGKSFTGTYFNGSMDDFKIYNYARTGAQIMSDYNGGAPVAWYKLDECQGSTLHDSSGNGFDGTLNVGGGGSQSAIGTCTTASTSWGNGSSGKYNSSLSFDGTDDYVTRTSAPVTSATNWSLSAWVKPTSLGSGSIPVYVGTDAGGFGFSMDANFRALFGLVSYVDSGYTFPTPNIWYHLVMTRDDTTTRFYVNGIQTPNTSTTTPNAPVARLSIGCEFSSDNATITRCYSGQVDDVRIYNYALSPLQVQTVFNGGSAIKFGP